MCFILEVARSCSRTEWFRTKCHGLSPSCAWSRGGLKFRNVVLARSSRAAKEKRGGEQARGVEERQVISSTRQESSRFFSSFPFFLPFFFSRVLLGNFCLRIWITEFPKCGRDNAQYTVGQEYENAWVTAKLPRSFFELAASEKDLDGGWMAATNPAGRRK